MQTLEDNQVNNVETETQIKEADPNPLEVREVLPFL